MTDQRTPLRDELIKRLMLITSANGFASDVGTTVYIGQQQANDVDMPCTVLTLGVEIPGSSGPIQNQNVSIEVTVTGYQRIFSPDALGILADTLGNGILDDIKAQVSEICAFTDYAQQVTFRTGLVFHPENAGDVIAAGAVFAIETPRYQVDLSK